MPIKVKFLIQQRNIPRALSLREQLQELLTKEVAAVYARELQYSRLRNKLEKKAVERYDENRLHAVKGVVDLYNVLYVSL